MQAAKTEFKAAATGYLKELNNFIAADVPATSADSEPAFTAMPAKAADARCTSKEVVQPISSVAGIFDRRPDMQSRYLSNVGIKSQFFKSWEPKPGKDGDENEAEDAAEAEEAATDDAVDAFEGRYTEQDQLDMMGISKTWTNGVKSFVLAFAVRCAALQ